MEELYEMEFYYDDTLIGVAYNLKEHQVEKLWSEWEEFKEECWCMMVYRVDEYDE